MAALAELQQPRRITQPQEHYNMLHQAAHGTVIIWERLGVARQWHKLRPGAAEIPQLLASHAGGDDRYLTVNQFAGWRTIQQLRSLRTLYVDIDGCIDLPYALEALRDSHLPSPSVAVFSGRGMHLYWIHEPVPAQALPVWQRCQDKLIAALQPVGADASARDCARVLRLVGSVNSKNSEIVHGLILDETPWEFHHVCDEILGYRESKKPAVVQDMATARAHRGERLWTGSIYDRWHLVYQDLRAIAAYYGKAGVPEGHRHTWLFLSAVALSWFAHPETLADELTRQARIWTPGQTNSEILSAIKQPLERAVEAAGGGTRDYQGRATDPRFRFRRQTLWARLEAIVPPDLAPSLRAIVSDEVRASHKKATDAKLEKERDRVAEGRHQKRHVDSLERQHPWEEMGISRSTYYRRQAKAA